MYSAVKINGQPLYKAARAGITVERTPRSVEIYSIVYEGSPAEGEYQMTVSCSKGTYIRTLLEDIATAMGQVGTMSALRRIKAGVYDEQAAHTLPEIIAAAQAGRVEELFLPVESVFMHLPLLVVNEKVKAHLINGCPTSHYPAPDARYRVQDETTAFLGLAKVEGGVLKVEKLFLERNNETKVNN